VGKVLQEVEVGGNRVAKKMGGNLETEDTLLMLKEEDGDSRNHLEEVAGDKAQEKEAVEVDGVNRVLLVGGDLIMEAHLTKDHHQEVVGAVEEILEAEVGEVGADQVEEEAVGDILEEVEEVDGDNKLVEAILEEADGTVEDLQVEVGILGVIQEVLHGILEDLQGLLDGSLVGLQEEDMEEVEAVVHLQEDGILEAEVLLEDTEEVAVVYLQEDGILEDHPLLPIPVGTTEDPVVLQEDGTPITTTMIKTTEVGTAEIPLLQVAMEDYHRLLQEAADGIPVEEVHQLLEEDGTLEPLPEAMVVEEEILQDGTREDLLPLEEVPGGIKIPIAITAMEEVGTKAVVVVDQVEVMEETLHLNKVDGDSRRLLVRKEISLGKDEYPYRVLSSLYELFFVFAIISSTQLSSI